MRSNLSMRWWLLPIIALFLALASGCDVKKLSMRLSVRPDGSGAIEAGFLAEKAGLVLLGASSCRDLIEQSSSGSSSIPKEKIRVVEDRLSEGRCRFSIPFQNFQELRSYMGNENTVRRLTLDPGNRRFEIDMDINVNVEETEFILDLPGTPLQHNAHEARGRQLIWRWTGSSYSPRKERIWASSTVEPEMISPGLLVLIVILMGVAALGFLFLRQGGLPRLSVSRAPAQRFCPHCGAPLLPGARFCSHCGRPV